MRRVCNLCIWSLWRRPKLILVLGVILVSVWMSFFVLFHGTSALIPSALPVSNTTDVVDYVLSSTRSAVTTTTLPSADSYVPLVFIFVQAERNSAVLFKLIRCLQSVVLRRTPVNMIFISDKKSFDLAEAAIKRNVTSDKARIKISFLNLEDAATLAQDAVSPIKQYFTSSNSSYGRAAFFLSAVMHQILPFHRRVIYVDVDVVFQADIALLYEQFAHFTNQTLFGLAYEQQPAYLHRLKAYRSSHPGTVFGSPPPAGHPGLNRGVIMFDLTKMRVQKSYQAALQASSLADLADKYNLQNSLGDADIFTLLNFEHPEWFYVIPCDWNRQLCVRMKNNGYSDVFKAYHACPQQPMVYHGNCNTRIPVSVSNVTGIEHQNSTRNVTDLL